MEIPHSIVGQRIRRLRHARGLSRQDIAARLEVDITAVSAWETGRYSPRTNHRHALAHLLALDPDRLFSPEADESPANGSADLVDTLTQLPAILLDLVNRSQRSLKALRIAAPYGTPAFVQQEFRNRLASRIVKGMIEVQRIEIFYSLARLKEVLSNVFRYQNQSYCVKSCCPGLSEVAPAMGGYFFDDEVFLLGAYWTGVPPHNRPGLRMTGEPFRSFFRDYWDEIWRRGTLLNMRGAHDLSAIREVALRLGLQADDWPGFVEEAKSLEIGDGAPPLV